MRKQELMSLSLTLISNLLENLRARFDSIENSYSLLLSTFLDPRFKNLGFSSNNVTEKAKQLAQSSIIDILKTKSTLNNIDNELPQTVTSVSSEKNNSVWSFFDKKVTSLKPTGSAQSKAIIEIQRYLEEPVISRSKCPLTWWKSNAYNYPCLSELVKHKFITICTSVPCERVFFQI